MIEIEDYYWDYCNATTAGQYLDFQERSIIYEFLDNYTPRLCLDIACGSGRFSLSFAERGICVVAGDRDPVPIKKLQCSLLGGEIWKKKPLIFCRLMQNTCLSKIKHLIAFSLFKRLGIQTLNNLSSSVTGYFNVVDGCYLMMLTAIHTRPQSIAKSVQVLDSIITLIRRFVLC